jgi:hypothetical protein
MKTNASLLNLAAAHPAAYCRLVDCCVRSQHFKPLDILVAADVLRHATAVLGGPDGSWVNLLGNTSTMRAHLSAFVTLVKRAAVATKAAGSAQDQPQQPITSKPSNTESAAAVAAQYFPAAISLLIDFLLSSTCQGISHVAAVLQLLNTPTAEDAAAAASSVRSSGSSSSAVEQQCRASAALLVVLLARSLVVLADAMEAAAAAAGMTPAQLLARWECQLALNHNLSLVGFWPMCYFKGCIVLHRFCCWLVSNNMPYAMNVDADTFQFSLQRPAVAAS